MAAALAAALADCWAAGRAAAGAAAGEVAAAGAAASTLGEVDSGSAMRGRAHREVMQEDGGQRE